MSKIDNKARYICVLIVQMLIGCDQICLDHNNFNRINNGQTMKLYTISVIIDKAITW